MGLDQNATYPIGTTGPSAAYPEGEAVNETALDALDGYPLEKENINDRLGFEQALLRATQQAASGVADTALVSQYLQGVIELASGRAVRYDESGLVNAYVLDVRTGQQFAAGLFDGLTVKFTPTTVNTTAATLDYNGTIDALVDRAGNALIGGELAGEPECVFDGTNWVLSPPTSALLAEMTVSGGAVTQLDFPNLDINAHKSYRIEIEAKNALASAVEVSMFINGDTTATNYYVQTDDSSGATGTDSRANNAEILTLDASTFTSENIVLTRAVLGASAFAQEVRGGASSVKLSTRGYRNSVATANIIQVTFVADTALALDDDTTIRIYRGDI